MNIGELAKFRGGIATDTISEVTSASGVTIDSVLCKDGSVTGVASGTFTTTYLKAADTQGLALVNSSGTSVVTVSDAGAVTAGASSPGDATVTHTMNCAILRIDNRDSTSGTDAYLSYRLIGVEKYQSGLSGTDYFIYSNTASANVALCSSSGAWTLGPSTFTQDTRHVLNGQLATYTSGQIAVSTSAVNMIDFANRVAGIYLVSLVREAGNVGTNGVYVVGYTGGSGGTVILYATLTQSACTASVATTFFKLSVGSGTENIYANALLLVGGS